ncbi:MAG: hypothetical protein IJ777_01400 [Clostridia bacterium]|nr:hypothetical protein [Clostridia bacterium]
MDSHIHWSFQRETLLPIVNVIGECSYHEYEPLIIQDSINIIEDASQFHGLPAPGNYITPRIPSTITVSFTLIFPSETDIKEYYEFLTA